MNYDKKGINRYEYVEIDITSTPAIGQQYYFPDLPQLRDAKIEKISSYISSFMTKTVNNYTPISSTDLMTVFLVLNINDKENIKMPLSNFVNIGNPSSAGALYNSNGYIPLNNVVVRWSKSYIKFVGSPSASIFGVPIGVFYSPKG